jgi:hypothetical protein
MERSVITNETTKSINRILKKYSEVEIYSDTNRIRGSFKITRYRHYQFHDEVEIEFKGEILAKYTTFCENHKWFTSEIYNQKSWSKVRINKFIKLEIYNELRSHCRYFGIKLTSHRYITKVKWI